MSFLAGRLAGQEGAYFYQESKHAVGRLVEKTKPKFPSCNSTTTQSIEDVAKLESSADILPEVLRHSLPSNILRPPSDSSLSTASKWALPSDPKSTSFVSREALNPLKAYVSLPQVTFGPKRWQLPNAENSFIASTANDSRRDNYTPINPEKLKATAVGLSQIAKAFAVATGIVFGGATLIFGLAATKLELHNSDDLRTKGKDLINPRFEMVKEQVAPLRTWAEGMSKKWHFERGEDTKDSPLIRELSKKLGAKSSS